MNTYKFLSNKKKLNKEFVNLKTKHESIQKYVGSLPRILPYKNKHILYECIY